MIWALAIELVLLVSEEIFKDKSPPLTIAPLLMRETFGESIVNLFFAKRVEEFAREELAKEELARDELARAVVETKELGFKILFLVS